jgi:hypothetical protein
VAEQPRDEIRPGRRDAGAVQNLGYAPGGLEDFHAFVESAGYDATEGMYSIVTSFVRLQ